ncbi:hypothetical protein A8709_05330 [Paenibacillus pectinilyticus]|uniref:Uncharacterized protein n=1 Tax=Paenibacillus pectinilyticus TaxID=512399 RepID=A0A1C0ZSR3_9BACL|nr:hypothetical protein [Paenibacillus pectinilyticus]OCT11111.1 hypothetical protein A8709_05330 [Paenibacillus pectinilyticus]
MQENSSHWLRRMREKHRRILGMNKLVHQGDVSTHQEKSQTGMTGTKIISIEQRRSSGGRSRAREDRGRAREDQGRASQDRVKPFEDQRRPCEARKSIPSLAELEADVWELRKQFILQIANRRNGKVKLQEVAAECNVNIRIAAGWLIRLSTEGMLSLIAGQRNTMTYLVKEVGGAQK